MQSAGRESELRVDARFLGSAGLGVEPGGVHGDAPGLYGRAGLASHGAGLGPGGKRLLATTLVEEARSPRPHDRREDDRIAESRSYPQRPLAVRPAQVVTPHAGLRTPDGVDRLDQESVIVPLLGE